MARTQLYQKSLGAFFSTQLVILLIFVLLLSKSIQLLAIKSGSETTAEQVVKRSIPKTLVDQLSNFGETKTNDIDEQSTIPSNMPDK